MRVRFVIAMFLVTVLTASWAYAGFGEYQATPNASIPDNGCWTSLVTSTVNVPDSIVITDLNIGIVVTHTFRSDLWIKLTSPASETITLYLDHAPDVVGPDSSNNLYGMFDEASSNPPNDGFNDSTASYANRSFYTYDYQNPSSIGLDSYTGDDAQGTWILQVCDDASADLGTLVKWALEITYVGDTTTTTTTSTTTTTTPGTTTTTTPGTSSTTTTTNSGDDDTTDDDTADDDTADDDVDDDVDDDDWHDDDTADDDWHDDDWFDDDTSGDDDDDTGPNWPGSDDDGSGSGGGDDDDGGGLCG